MRAFVLLVVAVLLATAIALGALTGADATKSGVAALSARDAASVALASSTTSPYLEVAATIGAGGGGAIPAGDDLTFSFAERAQHPPTNISAAGTAVDFSEAIAANGSPILQLRNVDGHLYGWIDFHGLEAFAPGAVFGPRASALAQRFGDRWYEVPDAFGVTSAMSSAAARLGQRLVSGARRVVGGSATFSDAPSGAGSERVVVVVVSGRTPGFAQPLRRLARRLAAVGGQSLPLGAPLGSEVATTGLVVRLTMSPGGVLLGASLGSERDPGAVAATVSHDAVALQAPDGALPLPLLALRALAGVPVR